MSHDTSGRAGGLLLQRLLGDLPLEDFFARHWLQAPLLRPGGAASALPLASWEVVRRLVETPACDLLLVRDGALHPGARPASWAEAQAAFSAGYTLALRQADRHDAALADLGRTLVAELHATLNLQLYCTPARHGSFGWHSDPEEVFILQTSGYKTYLLRENTVAPAPLPETLGGPAQLARETSPEQSFTLGPGDLLYIPGGWWHATRAAEDAVSLSVGLMPPTALAVLDFLRAQLVRSPQWRRRLPPLGRASPLGDEEKHAAVRAAVEALATELHGQLGAPALPARFFAAWAMLGMAGTRADR